MYYGDERWFNSRPNIKEGKRVLVKERLRFLKYDFLQKRKMKKYRPAESVQEKKWNVAICGMFKDEGPYLKEWVEYHLQIGIDHIYMYNNNSSDGFREILAPYQETGFVELIEWPYEHSQMAAYKDCLARSKDVCRWLGFVDLDEFVVIKNGAPAYEFFRKFEDHCPSVLLNWRMFGSSGLIERDLSSPVTKDFHMCSPNMHVNGKCFFNLRYEPVTEPKSGGSFFHRAQGMCQGKTFLPVNCFGYVTNRQRNIAPSLDFPAYINHYCLKSLQEYEMRMKKTDVFFEKNPHNMEYFDRYDSVCTMYDDTISSWNENESAN